MTLQDLRQNYTPQPIDPEDLFTDPFDQFQAWFDDAKAHGILEPNAFTLATASTDGTPNARTVLLKGIDSPPESNTAGCGDESRVGRGFVFYTNYGSAKGQELADNPRACMNFYWDTLARCVRISGKVSRVSAEETAAYFKTRPRASQLGAWASQQSAVIQSRDTLTHAFAQLASQYPGDTPIPVPPSWGGYRISPDLFEFWQGQPSRLHDRLRYTPIPGNASAPGSGHQTHRVWTLERLSP